MSETQNNNETSNAMIKISKAEMAKLADRYQDKGQSAHSKGNHGEAAYYFRQAAKWAKRAL